MIRSEILGAVKMKCYLSGMPELRLGLNDKVMFESTGRGKSASYSWPSDASAARGKSIEMEDVKFHQCVRLSRFENDRTISFIPPDGEFELMSYRLSTQVKPLVWVEASVESHRGSRVEYMVKVRGQFKRRSTANNVEIYVPVPDDADSPKFRVSLGSQRGSDSRPLLVRLCMRLKSLHSCGRSNNSAAVVTTSCVPTSACLVYATVRSAMIPRDNLTIAEELDKRAPISVKFEIPYFTVSGIQVRYLKIVEKSGYQALPWVRYITQNGDDYVLRTVSIIGESRAELADHGCEVVIHHRAIVNEIGFKHAHYRLSMVFRTVIKRSHDDTRSVRWRLQSN